MKQCLDLGLDLGQCLDLTQTGAIILASVIGVFVTVNWTRRIARKRATLDILLAEKSNPVLIQDRLDFHELCLEDKNLARWARLRNRKSKNIKLLLITLDRYELVAIGVRKGMIDEDTYKVWSRTVLVNSWISCKPFVEELREIYKNEKYFCEIERLARSWATDEELARMQ